VTVTVIVFARAPEPGAAKTRLIPRLGAAGAAELHARMTRRALDTARAAFPGAVELCCAPDAAHPFFRDIGGVRLAEQGPGDLGERMHRALVRAGGPAILIGSDCPALTPDYLHAAGTALKGGAEAVLGPAEDGGYVLIGARQSIPALFGGIEWGSAGVLDAQCERLRALGWRWAELAPLWDVDRPEDLERLRGLAPELLAGLA
jgi:rSAM/selenodomain-associated transferase 1